MGLLAYSGITTKVRAMESRLLKPEQFRELAEQEDVRSAADYLKEQPAYAEVLMAWMIQSCIADILSRFLPSRNTRILPDYTASPV